MEIKSFCVWLYFLLINFTSGCVFKSISEQSIGPGAQARIGFRRIQVLGLVEDPYQVEVLETFFKEHIIFNCLSNSN